MSFNNEHMLRHIRSYRKLWNQYKKSFGGSEFYIPGYYDDGQGPVEISGYVYRADEFLERYDDIILQDHIEINLFERGFYVTHWT